MYMCTNIKDKKIRAFPMWYCASVGAKMTNVLGMFKGYQKFLVDLKADQEGMGGV